MSASSDPGKYHMTSRGSTQVHPATLVPRGIAALRRYAEFEGNGGLPKPGERLHKEILERLKGQR